MLEHDLEARRLAPERRLEAERRVPEGLVHPHPMEDQPLERHCGLDEARLAVAVRAVERREPERPMASARRRLGLHDVPGVRSVRGRDHAERRQLGETGEILDAEAKEHERRTSTEGNGVCAASYSPNSHRINKCRDKISQPRRLAHFFGHQWREPRLAPTSPMGAKVRSLHPGRANRFLGERGSAGAPEPVLETDTLHHDAARLATARRRAGRRVWCCSPVAAGSTRR